MQDRAASRSAAEVASAYELLQLGQLQNAEAACRRALSASREQDPAAWTALGVVLREQRRPAESEAAYRRALSVAPRHIPAHHNLGALLSQLERAEEALAALERAQALGLKACELYINRGRVLAQLYRLDEAEQAYAQAVALEPNSPPAQMNLASLRYMRGDAHWLRDITRAVTQSSGDVRLQLVLSDLLRRSGDLAGAEAVLRGLLSASAAPVAVRSSLALVLREGGRLQEAEMLLRELAVARPQDTSIIESLTALQLALGRPEEALPMIRAQRERQPHEQRWIAYEATAARQRGDASYHELYDYEHLVRAYEIQAPAGFGSVAELNAAVAAALDARHRFVTHPLDQSLRNGSQTARSLVTDADPVIQALLASFAEPIAEYRAAVGDAADHPLTARNRGAALLRGCWSVALHRGGFHVNHIHPEGWLSSAYYVSVPGEIDDVTRKSGWIKFGEPRWPTPGVNAEHFVQPRAGRLVLFPSYMWHGTNAIQGDESRLTVAFDVVPTEAARP